MKPLYPDLWQTAAEQPFGNALTTHAYLWTGTAGNVLFYGTGRALDLERMRQLGGIKAQYLSHRDEAGPSLAHIQQRFGARLCCHVLEAPAVRQFCPVDDAFAQRAVGPEHVEVIPTPGHTNGSTCFLVEGAQGRRYLFTGDTLMAKGDGWGTFIPAGEGGNVDDLRRSLQLLRGLAPDVVLSSASTGPRPVRELAAGDWHVAIDQALAVLP